MSEIFEGKEGHIGGWFILTFLGILTLFIHLRQFVEEGFADIFSVFFNIFLPVFISLALVGAAGWVATKKFTGREAMKIGGWSLLGFVLIFALVGSMTLYLFDHMPIKNAANTVMTVGSAGGIMGFVLGVYDVYSSRRREAIERERDRAERLKQQITVLNRVFRHDVRQELTVLKGNTTQLRAKLEDYEDVLETIETSIKNINTVNSQVRELHSVIDAATELEHEDIDQVLEEVRISAITENPDVDIRIKGDTDTDVVASQKLHVAFSNIIENSIEHADETEIVVTVDEKPQEDIIEIQFIDTGPGIPLDEVEVIRSEEETQLHHASGLGLWIVNWIVKESGGDLQVKSSEDGTEVTISLPRASDPGSDLLPL